MCFGTNLIGREVLIGKIILGWLSISSGLIGVSSFIYKDSLLVYLFCMGQEEVFRYKLPNMLECVKSGLGARLNFFNPYRLGFNFAIFLFILVVPILYYKIFQFRRNQDASIRGISETQRKNRKQKNIVATSVNFAAWLLQVLV